MCLDESEDEGMDELGLIRVESFRVEIDEVRRSYYTPMVLPEDHLKPLSEKAKKIGCHTVG